MFARRAVIFACLFLFVGRHGGTVSLINAAADVGHKADRYTRTVTHEHHHSPLPSILFTDANGRYVCEGTLVTPNLVLTVASCVDHSVTGFSPSHTYASVITRSDSTPSSTDENAKIEISWVEIHEAYRNGKGYQAQYDVAFVELKEPAAFPVTASLIPQSPARCSEIDFTRLAAHPRATANWIGAFLETRRLSLETIQGCTANREMNDDDSGMSICAFASRESHVEDLGRGILCSQGFGKPPLLVGMVTMMTHGSNGDLLPFSINIPSDFLNSDRNKKKKFEARLVAGIDAEENTFGYAVSIRTNGILHNCNGALISPKHVLTVASCFDAGRLRPSRVLSMIGDIKSNDQDRKDPDAEAIAASEIILHPRKRRQPIINLAIIVLEEASKQSPLLLPDAGVDHCEDQPQVAVFGWGPTSPGAHYSETLQRGSVTCINHEACEIDYPDVAIGSDEICSFNPKAGAAICNRDDGTGMVVLGNEDDWSDDILIGIAGNNFETMDCGELPSKYIDIVPHLDWINGVLEGNAKQ